MSVSSLPRNPAPLIRDVLLAYGSVALGFIVGVVATNLAYSIGIRSSTDVVLRVAVFLGAVPPLSLLLALRPRRRGAYLARLGGALVGLTIVLVWAWELFRFSLELTNNSFSGTIWLLGLLPAAIIAVTISSGDAIRRVLIRMGFGARARGD